jgi:DNA-binding transcriptional ArsR family regulator
MTALGMEAAQRDRDAADPDKTLFPPPIGIGLVAETESTAPLPFRPLCDAIADEPEEPDWCWQDYAARSAITVVAGAPKVGKSTLAFGLFAALVVGEPFLGRQTKATRVLLLAEERGPTLKEKARKFGLELGEDVHVLMRHETGQYLWPEVVEAAVQYCQEHNLGTLVIDTWDKWPALTGDAENSAGAVVEALQPLQWAAGQGLAVIIVTHQRKGGGRHGEGVRGSNALVGGADIIIEVERAPASAVGMEEARVLRAVSRFHSTPGELVATLTENGYEACGDALHAKADALRKSLLAYLANNDGHYTADDLAEQLDQPESSVRRELNKLADANALTKEGQGKRSDPYTYGKFPPPAESLVVAENKTLWEEDA